MDNLHFPVPKDTKTEIHFQAHRKAVPGQPALVLCGLFAPCVSLSR